MSSSNEQTSGSGVVKDSVSGEGSSVQGELPIQADLADPRHKSADTESTPGRRGGQKSTSRSQAKQGIRNVTIKSGDELEFRIARLLLYQGNSVRRGREIFTVGRLDVATDLDVLAFRWGPDLRREITICECKSGGEGPLDRVFWLAGVRSYVGAQRAILARRATKWNIKDFAKEAGVEILTLDLLPKIEERVGVDKGRWPGLTDRIFVEASREGWNTRLRGSPHLAELCATLMGENRFTEHFGRLNYLIHHCRALTKEISVSSGVKDSLLALLLCEAVVQIAIHAVSAVGSTLDLGPTDRAAMFRKRLTFGELDPQLAERVLTGAHSLAVRAASHYVNAPVEIDKTFFQMPVPDYAGSLVELFEDVASHSSHAESLVPIVDLLLHDGLLKGLPTVRITDIFKTTDVPERLSLVTRFLGVLIHLKCLPGSVSALTTRAC